MGSGHDLQTRATLLARLYRNGAADDDTWREFVDLYGRQIYKWCRHWQLQDADTQEVTQQVLVQLLAKMKQFDYDPSRSFRAWLRTVSLHVWQNLLVSQQRHRARGDSAVYEQLASVPARDDLVQRLEHEFDHELLEQAMLRVRLRVASHTWDAFRLTAIDDVPAAEVARRLEMKIANVYVAKSAVLKLLKEETEKLERNEE
jgi:RNA polymerase sigma-70 factor (ECF subfamily)